MRRKQTSLGARVTCPTATGPRAGTVVMGRRGPYIKFDDPEEGNDHE